tara:strand:+ start:480 stop:794 length:315 start_codon:yes stop_codon:yes gene_type:complete
LVVVKEAVVGEEKEVVLAVAVQVRDKTFARFPPTTLAASVVEVFLEDMEVHHALPLLAVVRPAEEFEEVAGGVEAKEVKYPVGIEVPEIYGVVADAAELRAELA